VRTWPEEPAGCAQVALVESFAPEKDQRGGSHVVRWGDYYIAFTHEVDLERNYLNQKDGIYRHRLVVWDQDFKLIGMSQMPLVFLGGDIEFVAGAAIYKGDLLVSFGFQDNAAFVLRMPSSVVDDLVSEALEYESK
jgi:hypothetical protein